MLDLLQLLSLMPLTHFENHPIRALWILLENISQILLLYIVQLIFYVKIKLYTKGY